jgi:hypothetical protein
MMKIPGKTREIRLQGGVKIPTGGKSFVDEPASACKLLQGQQIW